MKLALCGVFILIVVFCAGCTQPGTSQQSNNPPVAAISISSPLADIGQVVGFNGEKSYDRDGKIMKYIWDFGDGSNYQGETADAQHAYVKPGTYQVMLAVMDDDGAVSTKNATVTVNFMPRPIQAPTVKQ